MSYFKAILCDYLNPVNDTSCQWVRDGALLMRRDGSRGSWEFEWAGSREQLEKHRNCDEIELVDCRDSLALPGFVDLHFHWVQDKVREMPKDSLLEWLERHTWPHEKEFEDVEFSRAQAQAFTRELLKMGTLGGACYGSLHPHTVEHGLDHFVGHFVLGNVLMTENGPDYLSHTEAQALQEVTELAQSYRERYAVTPRFAPTVSPQLMKDVARVAEQHNCFIQSHLSETKDECQYVLDLYRQKKGFEDVANYTEIYQRCQILGARTIMGHGIHLCAEELEMLQTTQTAIAHCPTSNAPHSEYGLGSGLFDFHTVESYAIPWALGSDIGGGPFLSMFDVMDSFVRQNREAGVDGASFVKALYRATRAGAQILGLSDKLGRLEPGVEASFILVDRPYESREKLSAEEILEKLCWSDGQLSKRQSFQSLVKQCYFKGLIVN